MTTQRYGNNSILLVKNQETTHNFKHL